MCYFIISTALLGVYEAIAITIYFINQSYYQTEAGKSELVEYAKNIESKGCGSLETYTMPNESLMQCGFATIFYGAYVFTLYRKKILMRSSMPI